MVTFPFQSGLVALGGSLAPSLCKLSEVSLGFLLMRCNCSRLGAILIEVVQIYDQVGQFYPFLDLGNI